MGSSGGWAATPKLLTSFTHSTAVVSLIAFGKYFGLELIVDI